MPLSGKQERDPASASLHASWSYYQDRTTLQGGSRPKSSVQTTAEQFLEKRSCSLLVIFPLTHSLLTLLLTESICTTLPREILQSSASRFNSHGGRKRVTHSNCISAATGIAPNPQSLKNKKSQCTADVWASRFLHRHSGAVSWNFKGNPTADSFAYC